MKRRKKRSHSKKRHSGRKAKVGTTRKGWKKVRSGGPHGGWVKTKKSHAKRKRRSTRRRR